MSERALAKLLSKLVSANALISQFREIQFDLEDTFLAITRSEKSSETAEQPADVPVAQAAGDAG